MNKTNSAESKEYKINEYAFLRVENGKIQLCIKNDLFNLSKNLIINIPTDNLERKINDYITIKLENHQVNIYIKSKKVADYKSYLVKVSSLKPSNYGQRGLISDFASEDDSLQDNQKVDLPPEIMFWAECSNLQEWAETNYDCQLLSLKFAFILLKELKEAGDSLAKRVFKEEIAKAFEIGNSSEISYLVSNYFLDYLNSEELEVVFKNFDINRVENQIPLVRIILLEKMYELGFFQGEITFKMRIEKEFEGLRESELSKLFLEYISFYAVQYWKEKFGDKFRIKEVDDIGKKNASKETIKKKNNTIKKDAVI